MTNLGLIAAAIVSLLAVAPAIAMQRSSHPRYAYSRRTSSAQQARASGYGPAYGDYEYYGISKFAPETNYDADFERRNTFN